MSSDVIRSEGSLLSKERIRHLARDERHSGITKWPRDIFANNEACSESLKGYLQQKFRYCRRPLWESALTYLNFLGNSCATPKKPTCDGTPVRNYPHQETSSLAQRNLERCRVWRSYLDSDCAALSQAPIIGISGVLGRQRTTNRDPDLNLLRSRLQVKNDCLVLF